MFKSLITETKDISRSLQQKANRDLTIRARGGIYIYLLVWATTAFWADMATHTPIFFYLNLTIFIIVTNLRILQYRLINKKPEFNTPKNYYFLVSMILFSALHWGVMTSWILFSGHYPQLFYPYIIIATGLALGGAVAVNMSKLISTLYPSLVLGPSIIAALFFATDELIMLVSLAIIAILFVGQASKIAHQDYKKAEYNQIILEQRAQELERLSITDSLTGLYNRLYFNHQFSQEWASARRLSLPLSVLMIDLDYFKSINDKYGHLVGDNCLKAAGAVLQKEVSRSTDTVYRYGGEEFVVLLPNTDIEHASLIAKHIVQTLSQSGCKNVEEKIPLTCSIGVSSTIPNQDVSSEDILKSADNALYQAKSSGRNQYAVAT